MPQDTIKENFQRKKALRIKKMTGKRKLNGRV